MSSKYLTEDEIDAKIKAAIAGGGIPDASKFVNAYSRSSKGYNSWKCNQNLLGNNISS